MTSRVLVGLSGPTFFDYQNRARRTANDLNSWPNPILENALGLTVFYDEVWFICESFCPLTIRDHPKVRYLDRYLSHPDRAATAERVRAAITAPRDDDNEAVSEICTLNFKNYWQKAQSAGAYWWNDTGRAIDNHTHGLEILGSVSGGDSNRLSTLTTDIDICAALKGVLDMSLSLNTFTKNIFNAVHPNQFHPMVNEGDQAILGSAVINAMVPNCILPGGPHPDIFDKISNSPYASQFRRYIQSKDIDDAYQCYTELVREIEESIAMAVRREAKDLHPTRGLSTILVELMHETLGTGLLSKIGRWYGGQVRPSPIVAAAFVLDVKGGV